MVVKDEDHYWNLFSLFFFFVEAISHTLPVLEMCSYLSSFTWTFSVVQLCLMLWTLSYSPDAILLFWAV